MEKKDDEGDIHPPVAMPKGDCFHCHKPGHWANLCPLKSTTKITTPSPPVIHCPCDRTCHVLTSKTVKNPNRRFYKCSAVPSCGFFKWCDQVSIKSQVVSVNPSCPCGSGPCRRVTEAHRSYFVCCIKKGFGACGFFQWENDAQIPPESEEVGLGDSTCFTLTDFAESDDNSLPNLDLSLDASVHQECKDVVNLETGEKVLPSKHNETQVKDLCSYYTTNSDDSGKESYALEVAKATSLLSKNIINPVSNDANKPTLQSNETEASCSSLMDLIEQFNSEKLHFESVSMKHVDALTAFTGSYKILESLRDTARNLSKQLLQVEKQVKLYEAKTSEFAASLGQVSGEMTKSQNKMVETARRVVKELREERKFAAP